MYIYKRIMFTLDIILIRSHFNFYMKRMFFFKTNESCRHQWYSDIVWSYYLDHMVIQSCLLYSIFLCIFIRSGVLRLNTKWIEANECSTINHRKLPQPYWYVVVVQEIEVKQLSRLAIPFFSVLLLSCWDKNASFNNACNVIR